MSTDTVSLEPTKVAKVLAQIAELPQAQKANRKCLESCGHGPALTAPLYSDQHSPPATGSSIHANSELRVQVLSCPLPAKWLAGPLWQARLGLHRRPSRRRSFPTMSACRGSATPAKPYSVVPGGRGHGKGQPTWHQGLDGDCKGRCWFGEQ